MSKKTNGVNYGKSPAQKQRRADALKRLEQQLHLGVKNKNKMDVSIPLTENDIKRIDREINILKSRM